MPPNIKFTMHKNKIFLSRIGKFRIICMYTDSTSKIECIKNSMHGVLQFLYAVWCDFLFIFRHMNLSNSVPAFFKGELPLTCIV